MSTEMLTKVQASPAQNFTPVQTSLLQRKSALCNTSELVEDSERDKEKLTLQRTSVDQAVTTTVPPIVHEVLSSPGQPLDSNTRSFMEPRFGHDFSKVRVHSTRPGMIQTKLKINKPGDPYEQEADRVAEQVMRMPESRLQWQAIEEELQAKQTSAHLSEVNPNLESHIQSLNGSSQPLPESTRAYFEPRFGRDFSQVRLHTDTQAVESAQALNAQAFTMGSDVVFGAGQYSPGTREGQRLMAHELTHVVQQRAGNVIKAGIETSIWRQEAAASTGPEVVNITIQRDTETAQSTTGTLTIGSHILYSLELPDRNNASTGTSATASRILAGTYQAHMRVNANGGNWRLELEGVPGRTNIQIHTGNQPEDITGCILPGTSRGADVVNGSVDARDTIRQEINNAGAGATIQVTIIDPPAAPTSP